MVPVPLLKVTLWALVQPLPGLVTVMPLTVKLVLLPVPVGFVPAVLTVPPLKAMVVSLGEAGARRLRL